MPTPHTVKPCELHLTLSPGHGEVVRSFVREAAGQAQPPLRCRALEAGSRQAVGETGK